MKKYRGDNLKIRERYSRIQLICFSLAAISFDEKRNAVIMKKSKTLLCPKCVYTFEGGRSQSSLRRKKYQIAEWCRNTKKARYPRRPSIETKRPAVPGAPVRLAKKDAVINAAASVMIAGKGLVGFMCGTLFLRTPCT